MSSIAHVFAKRAGRERAEIPTVVLGAMNFGRRTPAADARKIVDAAFERGIRWIDTANVYENGESEKIVGAAIKAKRAEWIVATKVGLSRRNGKAEGLAPETIRKACDESLSRLRVEAIDVYYLHAPDHATPIEQTMNAMFELLDAKKIRAIALSNLASWEALEILQICDRAGVARPVAAQQIYNLLVRQLDVEYFRFAAKYELHTTTYNALAGGLLAREGLKLEAIPSGSRFDKNRMYQDRYWSRAFFEAMDRYRALATEGGLSLPGLAYGWLAARPDVDSVLVGPASLPHLEAALDGLSKPLDPALVRRVDEIAADLAGTKATYAR